MVWHCNWLLTMYIDFYDIWPYNDNVDDNNDEHNLIHSIPYLFSLAVIVMLQDVFLFLSAVCQHWNLYIYTATSWQVSLTGEMHMQMHHYYNMKIHVYHNISHLCDVGSIPSSISRLSALSYLYLHFNSLTGEKWR